MIDIFIRERNVWLSSKVGCSFISIYERPVKWVVHLYDRPSIQSTYSKCERHLLLKNINTKNSKIICNNW